MRGPVGQVKKGIEERGKIKKATLCMNEEGIGGLRGSLTRS